MFDLRLWSFFWFTGSGGPPGLKKTSTAFRPVFEANLGGRPQEFARFAILAAFRPVFDKNTAHKLPRRVWQCARREADVSKPSPREICLITLTNTRIGKPAPVKHCVSCLRGCCNPGRAHGVRARKAQGERPASAAGRGRRAPRQVTIGFGGPWTRAGGLGG